MPPVIPPVPDADDRFFWDGVAHHKLVLQACADCGRLRHPPGPMCRHCNSLRWSTQEAAGRGHVYTWLVSQHPTQEDATPRIVALVELAEGVRIVSNLIDVDAAHVVNDMTVEVTFVDYEGTVLPQFRPVGGS